MTTKFDEGVKQNLSKHQELMNQLMGQFDLDKTTASKYAYEVVCKRLTLKMVENDLTKLGKLRTATSPDTHENTVDLSAKRLAEIEAEEDRKQAQFEAKAYAKGMRWAVDACIHPEHGGDDRFVTIYFNIKPDAADIKKAIKKSGSCRLDDHRAPRELKDPNIKEGGEAMKTTVIDTSKLTKDQLESADNKMGDLLAIHNALAAALRKNGHQFKDAGPKTYSTKAKAVNRILLLAEFAKIDNGKAVAERHDPAHEEALKKASADKSADKPAPEPPKSKGPSSKKPKGPTVREVAERLLLEKDAEGKGMPYSEVLKRVFVQFPAAKTTVACLRWYATHMRTDKGLRVPDRSNSVSPERAVEIAKKKAEGK
jgi:hypothetical protein